MDEQNTQITPEDNQEEFYYDDLQNESVDSIIDFNDEQEDVVKETTEDVVEDEPVEEAPVVTEEEKPASDVNALKAKIEELEKQVTLTAEERQKLIQENNEKILKALGKEAPSPEVATRQQLINEIPFVKENRDPASWAEGLDQIFTAVEKIIDVKATQIAEAKFAERDALTAQQQEQLAKAHEQINTTWDTQLSELTASGAIPALPADLQAKFDAGTLTAEDRKHESVQTRIKLFQAVKEEYAKNPGKYQSEIPNLKLVYYEKVKAQLEKQKPVGATAPINKGGTPITDDSGEFYYDELRNVDITELV